MKKFIGLIVGAVLIFGMAATAFAIHAEIPAETSAIVAKGTTQITLSGDLRVRGWYTHNVFASNDVSYYDERVRLAVDAASGGASGRIHLESNNDAHDTYTWGTGVSGPGSDFNGKPTDMNILEAWINYAGKDLLGVPAGIKLGHMPLALGPETLFFDNTKFGDDAIVLYADLTPDTHAGLLTIKFADLSKTVLNDNSDLDGYVGFLNQKLGGTTVGIYYVYLNQSNPSKFSVQDLGLHATGEYSGLSYSGEFDLNFGKLQDVPTSVKADGYAGEIKLGYKVDPIGVRAMFGYGSGDDNSDASKHKTFVDFMNPGTRYYTVVYDYQVAGPSGATSTNLENTTVGNIGVDFAPVKDMNLSLDGYYLRASKLPAGQDKGIGEEVDLTGSYNLTPALKYFLWAGWLDEGKFYANNGGTKHNATVVMHGLEYAF